MSKNITIAIDRCVTFMDHLVGKLDPQTNIESRVVHTIGMHLAGEGLEGVFGSTGATNNHSGKLVRTWCLSACDKSEKTLFPQDHAVVDNIRTLLQNADPKLFTEVATQVGELSADKLLRFP